MWTEERLNKMLTTPSEALSGEAGFTGSKCLIYIRYAHS